jgi:signal recognition particle receptor subunit beta
MVSGKPRDTFWLDVLFGGVIGVILLLLCIIGWMLTQP